MLRGVSLICSGYVAWCVSCMVLLWYLLPVPGGLVQGLQPHVAQSQHGVGVVLRGRLLQDALKLLLPRTPLLLGQVKVPDERPGVWVVLWSRRPVR